MCPEQQRFLSLRNYPARLNAEQAAWLLGFKLHEIPVLVRANLIRPLGEPPPNGTKFFATIVLVELRNDQRWLSRASQLMHRHWQGKNARRSDRFGEKSSTEAAEWGSEAPQVRSTKG